MCYQTVADYYLIHQDRLAKTSQSSNISKDLITNCIMSDIVYLFMYIRLLLSVLVVNYGISNAFVLDH